MYNKLEDFVSDTMVLLPKGEEVIRKFHDDKKWISSNYRMSIPSKGSNQTESIEKVDISTFYMSKYPVTNQLYNSIIGSTDTKKSDELYPKVTISWIDVIKFCNEMSSHFGLNSYYLISNSETEITINRNSNGFRLPTDAEWQYACKAGSGAYQYSEIDNISWHIGNSNNQIQKVGMKYPIAWGLYDMLGNIWEWCWDLYNLETYDSYRIFRGGSFAEESRVCGATTRRKSLPSFAIEDLGFRLARSI